jgi:delta14-sterol reductase
MIQFTLFSLASCLTLLAYEYQRCMSNGSLIKTMEFIMSSSFFEFQSFKIISLYFLVIYLLSFVIPGYYFQGPPLRDGRTLSFYCNGFPIAILMIILYCGLFYNGIISATLAYDHYYGLFVWANVIAIVTSLYLLIRGTRAGFSDKKSTLNDFIMGLELVPSCMGLHLNFFWLRPSMLAWLFINLSFLAKHYEINGTISHSMILYQVFTNTYVLDYFFFEEFVTSTWDIIAENFGFMLVWGDLVFIPFTFSIQAWYLIEDKTYYSTWGLMWRISLFLVGYSIFRLSNKQKHGKLCILIKILRRIRKAWFGGKSRKSLGGGY